MNDDHSGVEARTELAVSRAWNAQWLRAGELRTREGQPLTVVYRGRWTHNFGPDFQGALLAFGAELRQGDVEVHLRPSGWQAHGHHLNPAYNTVILHVVLEDEPRARPCRRQDGALVPTLVLGPALRGPLARLPPDPALPALGAIGDAPCIAEVTAPNRAGALRALERAGDARLAAKAAGFEAAFTTVTPGQALYAGLLDALGYSRNREPAGRLAELLPLADVERGLSPRDRAAAFRRAAALLLGVAGFLPLDAPVAALCGLAAEDVAALEREWAAAGEPWRDRALGRGAWSLARVRPANHPARRLLGLAALLARCAASGLLAACLEPLAAEEPKVGAAELRALLAGQERPGDVFGRYVGPDRAAEMVVNVVLPLGLAYGAWSGDERLVAGAAALWEVYPAPAANEPVRALLRQIAGGDALRLRTARQQQGALHLYRQYCQHRRCFECPIARLGRGAEG